VAKQLKNKVISATTPAAGVEVRVDEGAKLLGVDDYGVAHDGLQVRL
jgi:hypothetical protein